MEKVQYINNDFLAPKDAWDALSLPEKAAMMNVAVKNGIYDLSTIRQKYNEFAEGGKKEEEEYYSTMENVAEENYKDWGFSSPEEALVHALNDNTYNYRGYYRNNPSSTANATTHWPDTYKTAYHPTFSIESIYSGRPSQYNPQGLYGGHWVGDKFIPAPWQLENKHSIGGPLVEAAMNEYKHGGKIYIKPSHRGRLTELKKRTGKTEAELYNDGNPAHKRMVVFARNSRKWKHGLGGNLFSGEEEGSQQMETGQYKPGYSYTYSHKTTKGHTLSIKNDKVFLDGRPAPEGYRWFDKNNGNNYIVKNGVWVSEKLHGKDYNAPSNRHKVFNSRVNDINEEKTGVSRLMREGIKEQQRRLQTENEYYTPVDYPGVKTAKITTGTTFKGVEIPYNVLDSIYKYAPVVGIPENKALGLLGETSAGKYPVYSADLSSAEMGYYTRTPDYQTPKYPNKEIRGVYPTDLMNNHNYYLNNPYYAEIGEFIRKKGLAGEVAPEGTVTIFRGANEEQNALADERYPYILKSMEGYSSDNPWINAFEYLRDHDYNMGKGYQNTAASRGDELLADPAIKEYKKSRNR